MSSPEPAEPYLEPHAAAKPRLRVVALTPGDGREPPADRSESDARKILAAITAPWHPAILSRLELPPAVEAIELASEPSEGDVRILAGAGPSGAPEDYLSRAQARGAVVIEADEDRLVVVDAIRKAMPHGARSAMPAGDAETLRGFFALGLARHWLRDLTTAMGRIDDLDQESLWREAGAGALAWIEGDVASAQGRLRACFEILTEARERFYSVDAYIVDFCLLDGNTPQGSLARVIKRRAACSILATADAIDKLAAREPETFAVLLEAIDEGRSDIVGATYDESDEALLPVQSILHRFQKGMDVYRARLAGRPIDVLARRRFALYPQLPQVARRFQFRFGIHWALDSGKFPIVRDAKRMWESPDATTLEAMLRPPLAADSSANGLLLPWRLGKAMKEDHAATVPLAYWPESAAEWHEDLRIISGFSPVFARLVTAGDYFHLTDRPYETLKPRLDDYETPYLAQACARGADDPISRGAEHARLRAQLDAAIALSALAATLHGDLESSARDTLVECERAFESGEFAESEPTIQAATARHAREIAAATAGFAHDQPGFLVLNPTGVSRRAAVLLRDAPADIATSGPLVAAQFTEEGVWGIVELAPFGFARIDPAPQNPAPAGKPAGSLSARDGKLSNGIAAVEIDSATGGIRALLAGERTSARLGQQLVVLGLADDSGAPVASKMKSDEAIVDYAGPALAQIRTLGTLETPDGREIARFHQRFRLWAQRPIVELEITLDDIDAAWLAQAGSADPWSNAICCRWAWPDESAALRRSHMLGLEPTSARRPETGEMFEISARQERTAILMNGVRHHQRRGGRMLDSLLIAGRERSRTFTFGLVMDLEHPFQAATEMQAPAPVVAAPAPAAGSPASGWLVRVEHRAIAVTRLAWSEATGAGRGKGLELHLVETAGKPIRAKVRFCRDPIHARQIDFADNLIIDLTVEGDSVLVDLTPHEIARIDVTLF